MANETREQLEEAIHNLNVMAQELHGKLQDATRWVSVTERLPDVRVKVFVRMEKHGFSVGERRDEPGCRLRLRLPTTGEE